jgi:hypothetical protein
LGGHGRGTGSAHGRYLRSPWSYVQTASAAVVGYAIVVVDNDRAVVDVGDAVDVDAVDRTVVVEVIAVPVAALVAEAGVAEAIVNATVEADVKAPEAAVEAIAATVEAPVARCPERSIVRGSTPCAGNPEVAAWAPAPVAGSPEVVGFGGFGLLVDGEGRRRLSRVFGGLVGLGEHVVVVLVARLGSLCGVGLILSRWSRRFRGLGSVLFPGLLVLTLRTYPKDSRGWGRYGSLLLTVVNWGQVGVGWVRSRIISDCGGVGSTVATSDSYCSYESCNTNGKTQKKSRGPIHAYVLLTRLLFQPGFIEEGASLEMHLSCPVKRLSTELPLLSEITRQGTDSQGVTIAALPKRHGSQ